MRPERKRTLSRALQEAQETEAAKMAPPPKRPANNNHKNSKTAFRQTPGLPPRPHRREPEAYHTQPPVDAGIADNEWKALCLILAESARHAKGSGERSLCLENLYSDLRKIYAVREQNESSCQATEEVGVADEEPAESQTVDKFLTEGEEAEGNVEVPTEEELQLLVGGTPAAHKAEEVCKMAEEVCATPPAVAEEPLSEADTPTQQSPSRRTEKQAVCLKVDAEEEPRPMRTRHANKAK